MASLEVKLRTAALAYPDLVALLTNVPSVPQFPDFRWYSIQLLQGTKFPAVVVQLVSGGQSYSNYQRLSTSFNRVQFTIWDTDSDRGRQVEQVLYSFLDVFNPAGLRSDLTGAPNFVILTRAGMYPTPNPPQFWRTNDAMIFDNTAVS
jgi:hypothetical protein